MLTEAESKRAVYCNGMFKGPHPEGSFGPRRHSSPLSILLAGVHLRAVSGRFHNTLGRSRGSYFLAPWTRRRASGFDLSGHEFNLPRRPGPEGTPNRASSVGASSCVHQSKPFGFHDSRSLKATGNNNGRESWDCRTVQRASTGRRKRGKGQESMAMVGTGWDTYGFVRFLDAVVSCRKLIEVCSGQSGSTLIGKSISFSTHVQLPKP